MTLGAPGERRPLIWSKAVKLVTWVWRHQPKPKSLTLTATAVSGPKTCGSGAQSCFKIRACADSSRISGASGVRVTLRPGPTGRTPASARGRSSRQAGRGGLVGRCQGVRSAQTCISGIAGSTWGSLSNRFQNQNCSCVFSGQ